ncbi:MAG TPA: hypothetical protein PLZ86_03940, partial [bacterium]|nr:hypothetical protein [bacterium]
MTGSSHDITPRYLLHACHLAEALKLKDVDRLFGRSTKTQSSSRLVYEDGDDRYFFIYRFGSVAFFNVEPERRSEIIERLKMLVPLRPETLTSEEFAVELVPGAKNTVSFERAVLDR